MPIAGHALWAEVGGGIICVTLGLPERLRVVHAVLIMPLCLGQRVHGRASGSPLVLRLSLLMMLKLGLHLLECWLSWLLFWTLHWPAAGADLGGGGVSLAEILIFYVLWCCERLVWEKAVPRYRRRGRSISVSAVPLGPGTDIWRSCRFLGALFRALHTMPGGIGGFIPCGVGANHCRLRHNWVGEEWSRSHVWAS